MREISVTSLRRDLASVLKQLRLSGPLKVLHHKRVIALIVPPRGAKKQ